MDSSYDDVVYPSYPYGQTHPYHLNAIARMFGMAPPNPSKCRVLELGCAGGGNLIAMADCLPDAEFVGIDLSAKQIDLGRKQIEAGGLSNLRLEQGSITDIDESWGTFDYILCHGVYSWVPDEVRDKILEICKTNLEPFGIAYVSYNTYPGWHMRGMLREIMCFHASRFTKPDEQVRQSRMLLEFLSSSANESTPYGQFLRSETNVMRRQSDAYLFHEHLEENNQPCYFFEFAKRANAQGLQYLGDSNITTMLPMNLDPKIKQTLDNVAGTLIEMEQYLDFLRNRTFRGTLLCHGDVPLKRNINPKRMRGMHFWTMYRPTQNTQVQVDGDESTTVYRSVSRSEATFTSTSPILDRAMTKLIEAWPRSVPQEEFVESLLEFSEGNTPEEKQTSAEAFLLRSSMMGLFEFASEPVSCVDKISDRPMVSKVGRVQAEMDNWMSSRRHTIYKLDSLTKLIVPELDGERSVDQLIDAVADKLQQQNGYLTHNEEQIREPEKIRTILSQQIPLRLEALLANAVLVG